MKQKLKTKLRIDDPVVVIAGKDRGKKGKILSFNKDYSRVTVEGVNIVKKTMKKTQENQTGGIISQEAPLHISNIMYFDEPAGKRTRIGIEVKDGSKERFFKIKKGK